MDGWHLNRWRLRDDQLRIHARRDLEGHPGREIEPEGSYPYRMNFDRSAFFDSTPTRSFTISTSTVTELPGLSLASKLISSSSRSSTVCSRRAPIFSTVALISAERRASLVMAPAVKTTVS